MSTIVTQISTDGIENAGQYWFSINGFEERAGYEFFDDEFCLTDDDRILDVDGRPLTEGDRCTIGVRNALRYASEQND